MECSLRQSGKETKKGKAMGIRATITSEGQVTILKEVRDRYNPGDRIEFVKEIGRPWARRRRPRLTCRAASRIPGMELLL